MTVVSVAELRRAWHAVQDGRFRPGSTDLPPRRTDEHRGDAGDAARWTPGAPVLPVLGCHGCAGATTVAVVPVGPDGDPDMADAAGFAGWLGAEVRPHLDSSAAVGDRR